MGPIPSPMPTTHRRPAAGESGVSLVEFALVAPVFIVLVLGLFLTGLVVMNQMQLTNAARDGARAAAVCGGPSRNAEAVTPTLPDGHTACDSTLLINYIDARLNALPGGTATSVCVYAGSQTGNTLGTTCVAADPVDPNILDKCSKGSVIQVDITYPQQLYVPLIGKLLGDSGSDIRTLHARAQATCEQ
jgi:hypothetical protein